MIQDEDLRMDIWLQCQEVETLLHDISFCDSTFNDIPF